VSGFVLALLCALAAAQHPRDPEARFERLDEDGDGSLSRDELSILSRARFDELDEDDDDAVSLEEFRALSANGDPKETFRNLDSDEDGRIAIDGLSESMRPRFERADTNDDGFVDMAELSTMLLRDREARNGPSALMRRLMELDLDGDGRLHRDELPEAMEFLRGEFDRFDVNDDDHLDGAELRAMTEEGRRMRFRYRLN